MTLRSLARLAGSSPAAAAPTLAKLGWSELAVRANAIERPGKVDALLDRLRPHVEAGRKVLVFTAFRHTLAILEAALHEAGISAAVYHGSLTRSAKESAMAQFRDTVPVLLSTESAGEGRNLQFCHVMINVDLPWNPMQIEQRVGRLHRVGQVNDVLVTNLVARGTIEQQVLSVLEAKINLFELVVGELDMILGRIDDDFDFEASVFDAFVAAQDEADFRDRLEDLGGRLANARRDYVSARGRMDELVGGERHVTVADPGLDFWLRYVGAEGGLHERVGDSTLVLLPETLQDRHDQSQEMVVTSRSGGRPGGRRAAVDRRTPAADGGGRGGAGPGRRRVCAAGPAHCAGCRTRRSWSPGSATKLAVDHGRIDLTGGPRPVVRNILRVSSLVTFALSTDDHFQEQIDCWVDAASRVPFADDVGHELSRMLVVEHDERDRLRPDGPHLLPALAEADSEIRRRAELRRHQLTGTVSQARDDELKRCRAYYLQVADSLRRRMAGVAPDKIPAYAARLAGTDAERDRRIAEIEEKYKSTLSCLPFRLHVVGVPALRVEADIRRGNRRYPVEFDWLLHLRRFAPLRCAGCGSTEPLVAGKTALGCRACQPSRSVN